VTRFRQQIDSFRSDEDPVVGVKRVVTDQTGEFGIRWRIELGENRHNVQIR
jgi:hypothetical protein